MESADLKGIWDEVKGKLKDRYSNLTDDDLTLSFGKERELVERLQYKLGKSRADIMRIIREAN